MPTASNAASSAPGKLSRSEMVTRLRAHVDSGEFAESFPLPSERVLSDRFSSHRTTVRRALKQLIDEGVLRREGRRIMITGRTKGCLSGTAALLVPPPVKDHEPEVWRSWSEYITLNLSRGISEAGLNLLSLHPDQLTADTLVRLAQMRPLGVLVPEVFGLNTAAVIELCDAVVAHDLRVVVSGGDPLFGKYDRVASDHVYGGKILAEALIGEHRTRLAHVAAGSFDTYWMKARAEGAADACAAAGVAEPRRIIVPPVFALRTQDSFDAHVKLIAGHLVSHLGPQLDVDALMVASDRESYAVAAAVNLFGKVPGRDIAICGFDNIYSLCEERQFESFTPHFTVDKHNETMGRQMLELLRDRVDGKLPPEPQLRLVEPTLLRPAAD